MVPVDEAFLSLALKVAVVGFGRTVWDGSKACVLERDRRETNASAFDSVPKRNAKVLFETSVSDLSSLPLLPDASLMTPTLLSGLFLFLFFSSPFGNSFSLLFLTCLGLPLYAALLSGIARGRAS